MIVSLIKIVLHAVGPNATRGGELLKMLSISSRGSRQIALLACCMLLLSAAAAVRNN